MDGVSVRGRTPGRVSDNTADDVLVRRLVAGDDSALDRVYECHSALVHGLAQRVTRDPQLAREVTQDVFSHLWEHPDRVDLDRGTLKAYLGVMAHRRAVDAVRRTVRRNRAESRVVDEQPFELTPDAVVVDRDTRSRRAERLRSLVAELPSDQRAALTLAYYEGCTYREVATILGIPEGTAKSRLRLALAHLRKLLERDPVEEWQT